jgi:hypothetical protein
MNFKPNNGVRPEGETIPTGKRGVILPSTKEATALRQSLAAKSPRLAGKKIVVKEEN